VAITRLKSIGIILAPSLFFILLIVPPPENLELAAWRTAAVGLFMAILWITEAVPIPVTALLPIVFFPILGINSIKGATAPYANPLVFLFLGGFIIALGMQKWHLHRRIALNIINVIGMNPKSIIAGFMVATAFLSMWVSNTATTMMMLPIAMSVMQVAKDDNSKTEANGPSSFQLALLLGIAYSASIGGLGTLIGTPPNAFMAGFLNETYGYEIGFAKWMLVGIPLVLIGLPLTFYTLTKIVFPIKIKTLKGGHEFITHELKKLGAFSKPEKLIAFVFALVAVLWVMRPILAKHFGGLSDAGIAIFGAVILFFIPVDFKQKIFLLDWKSAEKLPWGVLLLFGGGLSLASAISSTGLSLWIGNELASISAWPVFLIVLVIAAIIIFLTELTSNTATAAAFLPIMASVAISTGQNPLLFVVPSAVAASCAFMLPVATPPNAIVYGSGKITIPQMAKAGFLLNIIFILIISVMLFTLVRIVFGVELGVLPTWAVN
jgi:solute carrier family 13 (sodium-dependent dicarboxylate transporter), member 2/3/5